MGWPRRRRAQQQQLRRQVSKESLALALKADPLATSSTSTSSSLLRSLKPQQLKHTVATWFDTASPHKAATAPATGGGLQRHRGLREKFYSVDSYAETEPEDDDDDEEDETESEGSENGTPHCPQHQHQHQHQLQPHVAFQPEPVIPEEKESEPELNETTDDEEEEEEEELSEREDEAAPAPKLSLHDPTAVQDGVPVFTSSVQFQVADGTVDRDDTESEDEAELGISSSVVVNVEETDVVAAPSLLVERHEDDVPSATTSLPDLRPATNEHAPFLFPPPYFPGDLDEYESDIYETLLRREKGHHAATDYFSFQPHVTLVMRAMLIDWLVEVHHHFTLQPDTLYLTVNYIDRFLAAVPVQRENFQLVALTALLIASKFEEVHPVDIEDLVYICERSYTAQQIVQFEKQMLAALQFHLVVPTCSGFLAYYVDKLPLAPVVGQLANFFAEQALLDFHLSAKYVPSVVASSAVLLAQCYAERAKPELAWVLEFEETTGYYAKDVWCCVRELSDMLASLSFDLVAVRTKFRSSRFGRVADLPHLNVSTMVIE